MRAWHPWHALWRSALATSHAGHRWTVDVDHFDWEGRALLHRDGRCAAVSVMPAAFPVPGAHIEVSSGTWGLTRAHIVHEDGREETLEPLPGTSEAWRARMGERFPRASRAVGVLAVLVLAVNLALLALALAQWATHQTWAAPHVDPWTSPLELPDWLPGMLVVAGVLAPSERSADHRSTG
ncbi:hypothetical protein, partial [Actinomyces polynesiensis]|uniref:hypothetical protein n=1 Tax=Actinomyces polynesiensis TaxID=1325934 RepID=UPI0011C9246D